MMKNDKRIRFSLSKKIAVLVPGIVLIASMVLLTLTYSHYRNQMFLHYEEFGMNIASLAAAQLDPDRIDTWLSTGEKDEAYEESFEELCKIQQHGGIKYLYVVKPEEKEVWYVMDTDPSEGAIPLGYHEPYYEGAFADNAQKMVRGEAVGPLVSNEEFGWLMSVYYPLRTSAGEPAGYVGVDIQMNNVMRDLSGFVRQLVVLMVVIACIISAIVIEGTSRTLATPIRRLADSAAQLVETERQGSVTESSIFSQMEEIKSQDEVGVLYQSLRQMEQDMNAYMRELLQVTAEKERIGAELNVATQIQADMLPNIFPPFPERREFQIYATMNPAKEVGGDFYDFFLVDDSHLAMVMADVSGKGVPAALFMVITKVLIKNRALMGDSPAQILYNVNNQLCDGNEADLFVTVWIGILDLNTGEGIAANAGHEHPVVCRKDGRYELVQYKHSPAVAVMENMKFKEHEFRLHPGDRLFVYTDGVPEATDADNKMFGTDRMLEALNENPLSEPDELLPRVKTAIDAFVGDAPQFDDITMLGFHYRDNVTAGDAKELTLEASVENLNRVLDFLEGPMDSVECPLSVQTQLNIAVEEIFVNIAHYAYTPGKGDATVRVETDKKNRSISVTFSDRGIPYNPLEKADPDTTLSAEERQIGGLGIFMVKKSMDAMEYRREDGMNILTIRKNC